MKAVVGRIPATPVSATLLDLSQTGCMAEAAESLVRSGSTILLGLSEDDMIAGQVVWREGERFGVHFHEPISEQAMARLMHAPGNDAGEQMALEDQFGRRLPRLGAQIRIMPS